VLTASMNWVLNSASYNLYYESEFYTVQSIDDAVVTVAKKGQPKHVWLTFASRAGRKLSIETRLKRGISLSVDNLVLQR